MKKWLAMLLSIVLTVQLAVPAWAADGGAEQPETVPGGYTETDPAETPTPEPAADPTAEPTAEPTPEPMAVPVEDPAAEDEPALLAATVVASGTCGDDLRWALYEDGILSITGTGSMYDFSGNGSGSDAAPWYSYRNEIKTVQIGDGATSIGDYAFAFCFYLADVTIPATVQSIGQNAFRTITALTSITIPEGVVSIGADAFLGSSLTSITIPSSVTSVGSSAFNGCTSLTRVEILGGVANMGMCAFQNCHKLTSVTIAEGTTVIGQYAFNCCDALPEITIPKSVTNIGEYAFNGCTSLKDVYYSSCSAGDWEKISAGSGIDSLQNITIHYLDHQLDDGKVTTEPTCEKNGEKTFTCAVCKETKTEIIEKLGHAFGVVEVIKAPTCTETGISGKRCQHEGCDVIDSETVLPATGHKWDNGKVTTEPTCTEDGVKTYTCSVCNETKTETITATGHQWDEGVVTSEPTYTENGEKTFTCVICRTTRTEPIPMLTPEPDSVDLNEIAKDFDGSSIGVDVDGKTVYPDGEGNYPRLTVPEGTTTLISVSTCNLPEGVDPHTRYPVSMAVYKATNTDGTTSVERISEMDDLLRYAGSSIRITGNKGIRLITGINASLKSALTSEGVAGYTLEEYGTLLCWASEVQNGSLSLSDAYARHNYAYSLANGTDPVFRYAGDVVQYTNVLVGFSNEQCVDDIAMRPYITLRDADGNTYTLYGGIVNRSIGYIAYQNRGAFTPGTNAYNYIWDIIHFVYGDVYDEDYKG